MVKSNLEEKVREIVNGTSKSAVSGLETIRNGYDKMYENYPLITNYLSSAVGTVGGDAIAKQFTDNPSVSLRDVAFTASAAVVYSYLAPKMIEWSTKATDKISDSWEHLKNNKVAHTLFNTSLLTAMYFPVNMAYWNYLTVKNQSPITVDDNISGAITLGIATIPYLLADYIAITKFSQDNTQKWLRPFYSGVELVWNTIFAGGNYLAKKF